MLQSEEMAFMMNMMGTVRTISLGISSPRLTMLVKRNGEQHGQVNQQQQPGASEPLIAENPLHKWVQRYTFPQSTPSSRPLFYNSLWFSHRLINIESVVTGRKSVNPFMVFRWKKRTFAADFSNQAKQNDKMKTMWMMIFFVLPIAGLAYTLWHIWQILPWANVWRWTAVGMGIALFLSMFLGFSGALEKMPLEWATVAYEVGNSAIFVLLYLVMLFLLLDICRWTHLIPGTWLRSNGTMALGILAVMVLLFGYGYWHYNDKQRVILRIKTDKDIATRKGATEEFGKENTKIVLLSDLHLGYHNRRREFARWVDLINAEHPDLVLIGGDIVDISVRPLIEEGVAEEFHRIQAPVYACLGNHEYYSSEPRAREFYRQAGITLLRDSAARIGELCVIGRDDRTNPHRKPLAQLTAQARRQGTLTDSTFTLLLDHQPYHLEEAEKCGIDFQFSGHTHHGQVWPASWVTEALYEDAFGPLTKAKTQYYVSSGMGIWGGKFRIGTRSEYVVLTLEK